ncbi:tyrosine-type recombinase/integrase [Methylorubrum thiocyanatum]|uniref:tyrosine-type recombinase/integrase n=1 Tax=Methylorubrum thiocyanatum TaxID=47958 RepID=UPI0035C82BE7
MRLTNQTASSLVLPTGKKEIVVFDEGLPGFGVRVREGGSRTWIVQYRTNLGQPRKVTLGKVGLLSATDARRAATETLAKVRLDEDPQAARLAAKAKAAVTLGSQIEPYLEDCLERLSPSYLGDVKRYLKTGFAELHKMPVADIKRADVGACLLGIKTKAGPYAANQARAALSRFYVWLIGTGIVDTNPVAGTNKPAQEVKRARVLSEDELAAVWKACGSDDFSRIVKLLILTGQRREEASNLPWAEVDLANALWSLPGARTKNGLPHDVPLSRQAVDLISEISPIEGRALIFGRGEGGFSGFSRAKSSLDERCGVRDWRLHDLRRTVATGLGNLGVLPHVVEAVLNHISGHRAGVAGIYNKAVYAAEKRSALDLWGQHVAAL